MESFTQRVKSELRLKHSARSYLSVALSEEIREAVKARMSENPDLDFAEIGRQVDYDPSSLRRWLLGSLRRIRCEVGAGQTMNLRSAMRFAQWLESEVVTPSAQSRQSDSVSSEAESLSGDHHNDPFETIVTEQRSAAWGLFHD
jgi:hypothetical protein